MFTIADMVHSITGRRKTMFWTFILIVALALTFVRLGAYSVLVSVLSGSLQLALLVIAGLTIVIIWRRVFGKR